MVMQKHSKIQDIKLTVMNFCESTQLCHISLPAKNEQNPPSGSGDMQPAPLTPPPSAKPGKMHVDVMEVVTTTAPCMGT